MNLFFTAVQVAAEWDECVVEKTNRQITGTIVFCHALILKSFCSLVVCGGELIAGILLHASL
jgi:hypothetical protein